MKVGILASSALVVAVILGAFALPDSYVVERSRLVKASPEAVYGMLIDVDQSAYWAPWRAVDRHMQVAASEVKKGVGASYAWKSRDHGSGSGAIAGRAERVVVRALVARHGRGVGGPGTRRPRLAQRAGSLFIYPDGTRVKAALETRTWEVRGQ